MSATPPITKVVHTSIIETDEGKALERVEDTQHVKDEVIKFVPKAQTHARRPIMRRHTATRENWGYEGAIMPKGLFYKMV